MDNLLHAILMCLKPPFILFSNTLLNWADLSASCHINLLSPCTYYSNVTAALTEAPGVAIQHIGGNSSRI